MTDDQRIRQIVREEIRKGQNSEPFGVQNIPFHLHNGTDAPMIKEDNIIANGSVSGSVTFSSARTYILSLNSSFTPKSVVSYGLARSGVASDPATEKYFVFGSAQLTPSFYFQSAGNSNVVTGGLQYPAYDPNHPEYGTNIPMQSCTYFGVEGTAGAVHVLASNFHIIDVEYGGTIYARATITNFSKDAIVIVVDNLETNWVITSTFVVT